MRFLFVSAQQAAHLDWGGYLATAAELARRGHAVLWASGREVAEPVQRAGVPFAALAETGWRWPPPPPLRRADHESQAEYQRLRAQRSLDQWLDVDRVQAGAEALVGCARSFAPDLVVSEIFVAAAGICAERLALPFAVAGWPAHAPSATTTNSPELADARMRLDALLRRCAVRGDHFTAGDAPSLQSDLLHLSYWSERWFAGASLLPQTRHVGGVAPSVRPPDPGFPEPEERAWVLITLGTTFHQDDAFFRMAAEAVLEMGGVPLLAAGPLSPRALADLTAQLPPGCHVHATVDFRATLPYCAAAIHHGGAGTTHALVTHGVPQIVLPHAGDQARQALGVHRSGVGFALQPRQATVQTLVAALQQVLPDRSQQRQQAKTLRAEFAALGGIPRAADLLCAAPLTG